MQQNRNYRLSIIFAATVASAVLTSGCAAGVRLYDADRQDYHRWDDREDRAYRRFLMERHQEYRGMNSLNDEDQRNYWRWRHTHEDAGN